MVTARRTNAARRFRPANWVVFVAVLIALTAVGAEAVRLVSEPVAKPRASGTTSHPAPSSSGRTSSSPAPAPTPQFAVDHPAAHAGSAPCTTVTVEASMENQDMVRGLAAEYAANPRDIGGRCVRVVVTAETSGDAETAVTNGFRDAMMAGRPTVWLPDSSAWLGLARASHSAGAALIPADSTSVARSAVVVAMPAPLAAAIGWTHSAPTWADVFAAAADPNVWRSLGHPGWGTFKLGKTSPLAATSGLMALTASYQADSDASAGLTLADVDSSSVVAKVTKGELATSHYMSTPQHFLWHAREAAQDGSVASFLSAMIVDENTVWDYNRGLSSSDGMDEMMTSPPREKLVPIYPRDGVFMADNPAVVLNAPWVSAAQRAAAQDFVRYATTAEGQTVVREHGYRDLHGDADPAIAKVGSLALSVQSLPTPDAAVLSAVQRSFPTVRKRARVLFLLDVSGSMNDRIAPGMTKLHAAQNAIRDALKYFEGADEVGLAAFSNQRGGSITPGSVTPVAPLSSDRAAFSSALNALHPIASTPLYNAVDSFARKLAGGYDPTKINAIVLLSDGRNDTDQRETRAQVLATLNRIHRSSTPVLIFTLAYGHDADKATLTAMASATGGHFYDASDPLTVDMFLSDLVTSF